MTIGKRYVKGWLVCYAFMLAFFLVMVPSLAYADTYVATEDSAVRAAMVYLGYDPDEGESTNKLVTAFYDATSGDEYTGWQSFVNGLYQPLATVNYNEQWWSPADGFMFTAQVDAARSDAAKIYAAWKKTSGGSSGGGSGGGSVGVEYDGWVLIDLTPTGYTTTSHDYAQYSGVALSKNYYDNLARTISGSSDGLHLWITYGGQARTLNDFVTVTATNASPEFVENYAYYWPVGNKSLTTNNGYWQGRVSETITYDGKKYLKVPYSPASGLTYTVGSLSNVPDQNRPVYSYYNGDAVEPDPDPDPDPEPDPEPQPPTPDPVPPDPDTPTPDPPRDPTPPTPDPTQPSQTIDLQGIIDRLDIIIRNQAILINWLDDAFASVNANIQWLGSLFDNLTEWLSSINQNIQWLGELIDESFGWLWELLDKLQGTIDGGITRITTWLEMIYNRIGGQGGTVSRPNIDTPTPWDDFLSWLEGILQRLLDLIFGVTPTAMQNLLSGLADLTTKFPFSIPWDLAALFALFAHDPVTPVADIPLMVPFANAPLPIHVDCTTWDGLAAIMRDGETILFAAWLVMETPKFYRHLNNVSGAD